MNRDELRSFTKEELIRGIESCSLFPSDMERLIARLHRIRYENLEKKSVKDEKKATDALKEYEKSVEEFVAISIGDSRLESLSDRCAYLFDEYQHFQKCAKKSFDAFMNYD